MPNLMVDPQQPIFEVSPYFNHRISMDTISRTSDGNYNVYVIVDAFTHYVVLHPSHKNDAANALNILFDHWIVNFRKTDIRVTDNGNEYIKVEFAQFCRTI